MSCMEALEVLKRDVGKSSNELFTKEQMKAEARKSSSDLKSTPVLSYIETEELLMKGSTHFIWRLYAPIGHDDGVGWILDQDISECLICTSPFSAFNRRHHCRSCGGIVCADCSDNEVVIEEFKELGAQRVCSFCYWGQHPVYASRFRSNGEDISEYLRESTFVRPSVIAALDSEEESMAGETAGETAAGVDAQEQVDAKTAERERIEKLKLLENELAKQAEESEKARKIEEEAAKKLLEEDAQRKREREEAARIRAQEQEAMEKKLKEEREKEFERERLELEMREKELALKRQEAEDEKKYHEAEFRKKQAALEEKDRAAAVQLEKDRQAEYDRRAVAVKEEEEKLQKEKALKEAEYAEELKRQAAEADRKAAEVEAAQRLVEQRKLDAEAREKAREKDRAAASERERAAAAAIAAVSVPIPSDCMQMNCEPGFVVKCANQDGKKVFINICGHENVQQTTAAALNKYVNNASATDPRGFLSFDKVKIDDNTIAYDVVINKGIIQECMVEAPDGRMNLNSIKPLVCESAIKLIREMYDEILEESYKLPKIRSGYKGLTSQPAPRVVAKDIFSPNKSPKRASGIGATVSPPPSSCTTPVPIIQSAAPVRKLNAADIPYQHHLKNGEGILASSLVNKPNPIGLEHKRQLILTDKCRLIYCEPKSCEMKGVIQWTPTTVPVVYAANKTTFELADNGKKTYKFIDVNLGAEYWVNAITSTGV